MSSDSSYILFIDTAGLTDPAVVIYHLRDAVEEADHFFDEDGSPSYNGGTWRTLVEDMTDFSKKYPLILFRIYEDTPDYDHKARHYFQNGKHARIDPIITWPKFNRGLLA